jgi:solute:Na+ symporter, SSS family
MLFVFYLFHQPPVFFNKMQLEKTYRSVEADSLRLLESQYSQIFREKQDDLNNLVNGLHAKDEHTIKLSKENLQSAVVKEKAIRKDVARLMEKADGAADTNDTNYIFLNFVTSYLPEGLIGLIIAVIFAASMSSTSSALNALASTSIIDIYKRSIKANGSDQHYLMVSRIFTVAWGIFVIIVAGFASKMGSLIEAVNVLGSLFYGTILGIFLVAFYFKSIKGASAFYAAIIAEAIVLWCYFNTTISFLWFNVIGCLSVILISFIIDRVKKKN